MEIKWKVKMVLLEESLINFILGIFTEIKKKVKVVLLKVSLMNFILRISEGDQTEDKNCFTRSIIDECHSSHIQLDHVEYEFRVIPSIIYGLHSLDV